MSTPKELLESVKTRFTPLLVTDEKVLDQMLIKALTTYQDRAGYARRAILTGTDTCYPYPDDYLELIHVIDNRGGLVLAEPYDQLLLQPDRRSVRPFTIVYLVNLREVNLEEWQIPASIIGYLDDYLYHLILMANTERIRRVSIAGKLDVSALPDEVTLYQRKIDLETAMSANRAIITGATML